MHKNKKFARPFLWIIIFIHIPHILLSQNADSTKSNKFLISPIVYFQPETSWAFGAGAIYFLKFENQKDSLVLYEIPPTTNISQLNAISVYTLKKQFQFYIGGSIYTPDNDYFISTSLGYYKFPNSFFGIGNQTLEENEERYTNTHPYFKINVQKNISTNLYTGLKTFFEHSNISQTDSSGILETENISGIEGGFNIGVGPWITLDKRNNIFYPTKGIFLDASSVFHQPWVGSEYAYIDNEIECSYFISTHIGKTRPHVVALNLYAKMMQGNVPFNRLGELGGAFHMRGYYEGRYRDKNYFSFQSEYRIPFLKYFSANVFASAGEVAQSIDQFNIAELKYAYGGGLRISFSHGNTAALRIDYGIGQDGNSGFYIQFNEAF